MSSGTLILPSVNRGFARVVAQHPSGIVAYACRNSIYFIDARSSPPLVLDSKFMFKAHAGKVIALSFCKNEGAEILASIGDDRQLKVWDVETKTCLVTTDVKECTRVVEFIYGTPNCLVYPSYAKTIIKWEFDKGVQCFSKIKTPSDVTVTQIVSNEKLPNLLSIGYMNGSVIIIDIVKETIMHKLKVHSNEISSLSWSPVVPDNLLSVSLDLSLRMWKVGENQPLWSYYMPTARQKFEDKKKLRIAGICHPSNPNAVICSNLRGDVGEVVYSETEKPKFSFYYQGSCDLNCKSTFSFFLVAADEGKTDLVYCFDPFKITMWNVTEKRLASQIPFMFLQVYDLTLSSVNPNLLAISNGEGILKVWNSLSEATKMDMISVYVHIRTRIMTAAWHPTSENIIAYATDEGRVGVIDIFKRKSIYSFESHHPGPIYCLNWGPCEKAEKADTGKPVFYLYSCGGGVVYIHKENDAKGKALNFDDLVELPADLDSTEKTHSELSWKSDYSCLCVGSFKGFIDVYSGKLVFLMRFNVQMKSVECLRWHPESTYMSPEGSSLKAWLACSGNDEGIHIIDTASTNEQDSLSQGAVKKLVGHNKRVVSLCWSQHKDGFLASASKDGSAIVWDVQAGSIIATYVSHQDVVLTVQWSVFDQDIMYSGGQDGSVRIWKISEQTATPPPTKAPRKKKLRKPAASSKTEKNSEEENTDAEERDVDLNKVVNIASKDCPVEKSQQNEEKVNASLLTTPQAFPSKKLLFFPYHQQFTKIATMEDLNECMKLADILNEKSSCHFDGTQSFESMKSSQNLLSNEDFIKFGLFTDQLTAIKMIESQGDLHKTADDLHSSRCLQIMAGNTRAMLEEAAKTRTLSFFLVSLAPTVSYSFWLEMCEAFALQLVAQHRFTEASFYYLSCGKTYEAINVMSEKGNVIDALALAKARLPESDPLIQKLLIMVRRKFSEMSNYLGEAQCYLSLNQPLAAAKVLASSNDPNYIRVAAYICKKFKLDREAEEYRFLCIQKCLTKYDYAAFKLLLNQEPCMQVYSSLVLVHEALHRHILKVKNLDGVELKEVFAHHDASNEVQFWKGRPAVCSNQSFIAHVQQLLSAEGLSNTETSALSSQLDALEILSSKRNTLGAAETHVTIAIYITKFIIFSLLQDTYASIEAFLKIFESSYSIFFFPKVISLLLFPICLSWKYDTSEILCTDIITEENINHSVVLEAIYKNFHKQITCYIKQPIELFITSSDLQSNLRFITSRIAVILDTKQIEEHLLAYFVSNLINDLTKLVDKKLLKLICHEGLKIPNKAKAVKIVKRVAEQSLETGESMTCDIDKNVSEETSKVEVVEKLIKLAIEEAEEKGKSFMEQNTIPIEVATSNMSKVFISEENNVENTNVTTNLSSKVVQFPTPVDIISVEVPNFANNGNERNSNTSNNEETVDSHSISDISPEKSVLSCTKNISNNGMLINEDLISENDSQEKVLSSNEQETLSKDIPEDIELLNSEPVTPSNGIFLEINDSSKNVIIHGDTILISNNDNTVLAEDLLNNKLVTSNIANNDNMVLAEDLHDNELATSEVASNDNVLAAEDLPNNELTTSNIASNDNMVVAEDLHDNELTTSEVASNDNMVAAEDLPNNELATSDVASNNMVVAEDLPNNELTTSIVIEEVEKPNKNISDSNVVPKEEISSNHKIAVPNNCNESEKTLSNQNDSIQSEKEDLKDNAHEQCLKDIDMFYNIISFITQNICKDEFALLFYLKKRVEFLHQARATEELEKFAKEKKTIAKLDATTKKTKSTKVPKSAPAMKSLSEESSIKSEESIIDPSLEISANGIDQIADSVNLNEQVLEDKVVDKLENPDQGSSTVEMLEQQVATEMLEQQVATEMLEQQVATEMLEQQVGTEMLEQQVGTEMLEQQVATEMLEQQVATEMLEQQVATEMLEQQVATEMLEQQVATEMLEQQVATEMLEQQVATEMLEQQVATEMLEQQVATEMLEQQVATEMLEQQVATEMLEQQVATEMLEQQVATEMLEQQVATEMLEQQVATEMLEEEVATEILEEEVATEMLEEEVATEMLLEQVKLSENICKEHNYATTPEDANSRNEDASNAICDKDIDLAPEGNAPSNLQNKLEEISELICILEKKSEKFCYPNPFDAIPKILKALFEVSQKSACKFVQEKLHSFMHDIIIWVERYSVGEVNFVCQICQKTPIM